MAQFKNMEPKKRQLATSEAQSMLKEEILQLQKELEGQTVIRSALEKAMMCQPLVDDPAYKSLSEPAENLIKEIALLEMEVVYLEKYLLSMYRKSFSKRLSTLPTPDERQNPSAETSNGMFFSDTAKTNLAPVREDSVTFVPRDDLRCNDIFGPDSLADSGIFRSQSSLSHRSAYSFRSSPPFEGLGEAVDSYHSLPLSMFEGTQDAASSANLAEYLGSSYPNDLWDTPNRLSEDMIKCISTIYCHISDPPLHTHSDSSSSPTKVYPECEGNSSFSSWLTNPSSTDERRGFSGSSFGMVEVQGIFRDTGRLDSVKDLLDNYRFLISRLAQLDPGKLKHEEKLAFWINVHNSLVMHAYLVYGIPRANLKRISMVAKAAYNIGGHTISVETIQTSILRCRLPRPSQWLQSLFSSKDKFKAGDPRKTYAIKHPEPRLRFALCSGCQSDAAICVFTPQKVFQELEMAKEDYVKMNIKVHKEQRLLIPKNVDYFVKESDLSPQRMEDMLELSMPDSLRKNFQQGKLWKKIDWVPYNFTFRFLLTDELVTREMM